MDIGADDVTNEKVTICSHLAYPMLSMLEPQLPATGSEWISKTTELGDKTVTSHGTDGTAV